MKRNNGTEMGYYWFKTRLIREFGGRGDEGKSEIQKFEYLEKENNFLVDELKSIFHNYLRVIIC